MKQLVPLGIALSCALATLGAAEEAGSEWLTLERQQRSQTRELQIQQQRQRSPAGELPPDERITEGARELQEQSATRKLQARQRQQSQQLQQRQKPRGGLSGAQGQQLRQNFQRQNQQLELQRQYQRDPLSPGN